MERSPSQQLDAVYFDTPGRDLAAHHVTLRRRTGGPDAGWHLKLPAGPDARTEVRAPLGDAAPTTVPEALRDVVLAIVRDRPLGPVARISTSRTVDMLYGPDGAALAEFCDDQVDGAGRPDGAEQRWREWELELAEGGDRDLLDRLTNRLLDAGAVPAGHGSKLARVLEAAAPTSRTRPSRRPTRCTGRWPSRSRSCWCGIARCGPTSYDSVHQMRVTTRKIRSLLQASEGAFGISDDAWILDELRQLAGGAGGGARRGGARRALREGARRTARANWSEARCGSGWSRAPSSSYQSGLRRSLIAMRSQRYFRLLDALEALVAAEPPPPPPGERAGAR